MRPSLLIFILVIFGQSYGDPSQCGKVVRKAVATPLAVFGAKTLEGNGHGMSPYMKLSNPEYNHMTFDRNLAIVKLREPFVYTDWVQPVCLWPENMIDLDYVIGKTGSVVGWGIDESNLSSEELKLVEMPIVDQNTCIKSYVEFFARFTSNYTYCAGNRNGTSLCNGDSGGGIVFNSNGTWYLRGIVSLGIAINHDFRCDPNQYVIFTDLAKFLPWIQETITGP